MQLYINKHGCSVQVRDGFFVIKQLEGEETRVPAGSVHTIFINRGSKLSAEVAFLAAELDIDVMFTDRNGQPVARLWGNRFGSIATIRKQQLAFSQHAQSLDWVKQLLAEKVEGQIALMWTLLHNDRSNEALIEKAAHKLDGLRQRILEAKGQTLPEAAGHLRALEGSASKAYWQAVSDSLPHQYTFAARSRRPATDMFNAMLNYGYGILYGKVESALIKAGIDPYIGIFHRDEYNRPVLVYDVVERFRVWVDYVVISLCRQQVIFPEFFDIENGGFWLNEHGKRILIQTQEDYFEEITAYRRLDRSRNTHLELYGHALAGIFKQFKG